MIKILFITDNLRAGGKERQLIETLKYIDRKDFSIDLITFNKEQHYTEQAKALVNDFYEIKKGKTKLFPVFKVFKIIKSAKYDIIHTWDSLSTFYSILAAKRYKIFLIDGSIRDAGIESGWSLIYKKILLKASNLILSNSFAGLKAYNVKGKVIYNTIDQNRFIENSKNIGFNVIQIANFKPYKDHNTFFSAMINLAYDKIIDKVYVIGDGNKKEIWRKYIADNHASIYNAFIFTGSIRNIEKYLALSKIGVLCSTKKYKEGVSNAILEYMAAGLVPVATAVGATPEIIENGKDGYLFPVADDMELYNIIKSTKKSDNEWLINNAKQKIQSKFSKHSNIGRLEKIYNDIFNKHPIKPDN